MLEREILSAEKVSSFVLESLLWNLPDYLLKKDESYTEKFQQIINYIVYVGDLEIYKEANGIKKLCETTIEKENLKKFINDLKSFFEPVN